MADIIAYYRVSTRKQAESGLELESQKAAAKAYAKQTGARILATYREVETGKRSDRPELAKALAHAKRSKATLCVAKLDRLARNVEFLVSVMNSGADFIAIDNPNANRLTLHIFSAIAENEARAISDRTKVALTAAKARGTKLGARRPGHWDGREDARLAGLAKGRKVAAKAIIEAAREAYSDLAPAIQQWRTEGLSLQAIADKLNAEGHSTRRGAPWNPVQVSRVLARTEAE